MKQRGFTLIEMLLAVTLMAMVLAMAFQGIRGATGAVDRGEEQVDRNARLRIVHQFMRGQIEGLLPLQLSNQSYDASEVVLFEGDAEGFRFAGNMPGYLSSGGPHEQAFRFEREGRGWVLLFEHQVAGAGGDEFNSAEPIVLMEDIEDVSIEYLQEDEEAELIWVGEWEDTESTPRAIRIDLRMAPEPRVIWPLLQARPLIDGTAPRRSPRRPTFDLNEARRE